MRQSIKTVNKRRDTIFTLILENQEMSVHDLARQLQVSELTIRRDLNFFETKDLIERYYGGARLKNDVSSLHHIEQIKRALAKKAAEYVNSGDIIFLNSSSTVLYMIRYLKGKEVTIVTNNGKAIQAPSTTQISVILTGGEVRIPKNALVGDYALQTLMSIRASKCFLGCSGFSTERGMSTSVHSEVSVNKQMLRQTSGPSFVVANSAKIENDASFIVAQAHEFSGLITDTLLSEETREKLEALNNFELILVNHF